MTLELGKSAKVSTTQYKQACDTGDLISKIIDGFFKGTPKHELRLLITKTIHLLLELYRDVKDD